MIPFRNLLILFTILIWSTVSFGQTNKTDTDHLHVPGPIVFENKSYNLVWTSHVADSSSGDTYKQEYIANDDTLATFRTMILIDVVTGKTTIEDLVDAKIAELNELKALNPIVNFETFNNKKTGEYMIDFLISENSPDGQYINMAERNVYRYKTFTDKEGQDDVLLFGVSKRSYGDDIDGFLTSLKSKRSELIKTVGKFIIPEITITN